MSDLLIGVLIGASLMWIYHRVLLAIWRSSFAKRDVSQFGRDVFDRMGYESIVRFRDAADAELEKRRGNLTTARREN